MTTESAGMDLDNKIAVMVMGYRDDGSWPHTGIDEEGGQYDRCPLYSREIKPAWEVVEALRSRGVFIDVQPRSDRWDCVVGWAGSEDEEIWVTFCSTADSAPLAICRAAMRATIERTPPDSQPNESLTDREG